MKNKQLNNNNNITIVIIGIIITRELNLFLIYKFKFTLVVFIYFKEMLKCNSQVEYNNIMVALQKKKHQQEITSFMLDYSIVLKFCYFCFFFLNLTVFII